jgi:hypothetical protein
VQTTCSSPIYNLDVIKGLITFVYAIEPKYCTGMFFSPTDQLDKNFVTYLVTCVENAPDGQEGDQLIDSFVGLLLAFNQHFSGLENVFYY